jgi:hypothetical protein
VKLLAAALAAGIALGCTEGAASVPTQQPTASYHSYDDAKKIRGIATWYAARCPAGVVYLDRTDSCWPYLTKSEGGRGGEQRFYGALGSWRYKDTPYEMDVVFLDTGRIVRFWIRDYCQACADGRVLVDLSPLTVLAGGLTLGQGRYKVELREVPADKQEGGR